MAKFRVQVTVKAEVSYMIEVEAESESCAEDLASGRWREETPNDFQVDKGYITDWKTETEQLTADCPECGQEHQVPAWDTKLCHCAAIGRDKLVTSEERNIPHLVVDGVCTPAPWWYQDQDVCAACGVAIEAKEEVA